MIKTGLPYDFDIMEQIEQEGAIVDISNTSYPCVDDIERTTLIYLRNTDFKKIILDFSNLSYQQKEKYLQLYLIGDIEYNIKELTNTFINIFGKYKNIILNIESILTDEEENIFIKNNQELLLELDSFVYSLPLYSISRLETEDFTFSFDNIIKTDFVFNMNICDLIKHPSWNLFYEESPYNNIKFYTKMFSEDNNKLFETVMKFTPFSILLYGMNNPEEWKNFINLINQYKEYNYE